jgi:hypothetical protein
MVGSLPSGQVITGDGAASAKDGTDRIICDTTTGRLYHDADGIEGLAAVQIAQL